MVVDTILDLLQALVSSLLSLVPEDWVPSTGAWPTRAGELADKASYAGHWIPFEAGAAAALSIIGVWVGLQSYAFALFILKKIRVVG